MPKDPYKIHQVSGHQANITCLYLTQRTAFLFSGGEDRLVNVWKLGSPSKICELTGSQSTIECLTTDINGTNVYAGSQGGSIKSFSVDEEKVIRTFKGHLSSCTCVDLSPVQEILASGSLDTNVKIWDKRSKSAISTSKSHKSEITCVRFCPSEHLLLSGAKDGVLMLWDLRKSKGALMEFIGHTADICDVAFNSINAFFVSCSTDKTIKSWDLDETHFESSTAVDTNQAKCLSFLDESTEIVAANNEGVKLYSTEPLIKVIRNIDVKWNSIAHAVLSPDGKELVGADFYGSFITVFAVPLMDVNDSTSQKKEVKERSSKEKEQQYYMERLHKEQEKQYKEQERPKTPLIRSAEPLLRGTDTVRHFPLKKNVEDDQRPRSRWGNREGIFPNDIEAMEETKREELSSSGNHCNVSTSMNNTLEKLNSKINADSEDRDIMQRPPEYYPYEAKEKDTKERPISSSQQRAKGRFLVHNVHDSIDNKSTKEELQETLQSKPLGLDFQQFIPDISSVDENSILDEITKGGEAFTTAITNRLGHLRVVASFWQEGNPQEKGAILHIQQFPRPARDTIVVDFLSSIDMKILDLDTCAMILPLTISLFQSEFRRHLSVSFTTASLIVRTFGPLIHTTCKMSQSNRDVDLQREERLRKCILCQGFFRSMMEELLSRRSSKHFQVFLNESDALIALIKKHL